MLKEGPRPQISQVSAGTGVPQLGSLHHILCMPCGQHFGDAPAWPWAGAAGKEGREGGSLAFCPPLEHYEGWENADLWFSTSSCSFLPSRGFSHHPLRSK